MPQEARLQVDLFDFQDALGEAGGLTKDVFWESPLKVAGEL